jgi:hypothetical protein
MALIIVIYQILHIKKYYSHLPSRETLPLSETPR